MAIAALDHINIRTANLAAVSAFYEDVLGLRKGPRPPFDFGGAWHYCGDTAVIHLVDVEAQDQPEDPPLDHFAFRAADLAGFLERLKTLGVSYETRIIPRTGGAQINVHDPDGNKIEVQFAPHETPADWLKATAGEQRSGALR